MKNIITHIVDVPCVLCGFHSSVKAPVSTKRKGKQKARALTPDESDDASSSSDDSSSDEDDNDANDSEMAYLRIGAGKPRLGQDMESLGYILGREPDRVLGRELGSLHRPNLKEEVRRRVARLASFLAQGTCGGGAQIGDPGRATGTRDGERYRYNLQTRAAGRFAFIRTGPWKGFEKPMGGPVTDETGGRFEYIGVYIFRVRDEDLNTEFFCQGCRLNYVQTPSS
ncbi:hypothetical protein QBC45DRAFT_442284 [Copromyces sp. CBS 386.78]|nr:hypothetical protein QBC45DRAFT_442284 [Copromyces sp. CBS 386.78]